MIDPNGLLIPGSDGYLWSTACRKCGTAIKINLGQLSLDEARRKVAAIDSNPMECPGYHVELTGWARLWSLDLMLREYEAALTPKAKPELEPVVVPLDAGWPSSWAA